jgi:hypothetical protein
MKLATVRSAHVPRPALGPTVGLSAAQAGLLARAAESAGSLQEPAQAFAGSRCSQADNRELRHSVRQDNAHADSDQLAGAHRTSANLAI